jgi:hypothetical protein
VRGIVALALTSLAALPAASAPPVPAPAVKSPPLAGIATILSMRGLPGGADVWRHVPSGQAWAAIAASIRGNRQAARWDYARSLIADERGAEAFGVLETMVEDEPALATVDAYRLARAAALIQLRRAADAIDQLASPGLARNPEACAWRLLALGAAGQADEALRQLDCARPALAARPLRDRRRFVLAASHAAIAAGQGARAVDWLRQLPAADPSANLARGEALLASGRPSEGVKALALAQRLGSPAERMDARLGRIEAGVAQGSLPAPQARRQVDAIRYAWRGDAIEERALELSYRLATAQGDLRGALTAGSTLFNYFDTRAGRDDLILALQRQLASTLDPANRLPLDEAAGLYWDFRELGPIGAEGDLLVARLAERLQEAGLYARAAELLEHQLMARAHDLAKGPLSARVAALHILAGHPQQALAAIRATERGDYPPAMRWERQRVAAVALFQVGREDDALRVLRTIPGGAALSAEIHWRRREWSVIEADTRTALPASRLLSDVQQVIVLRHAIALAMLGREAALAGLHRRYAAAFAGAPSEQAFDVLTAAIGSVDPAAVTTAMAAIPTASPAGTLGDLLDAAPAG